MADLETVDASEHLPDCAGATACGGTFVCATCGQCFGWCQGQLDEYPDDCDVCANEKYAAQVSAEEGARSMFKPDGSP